MSYRTPRNTSIQHIVASQRGHRRLAWARIVPLSQVVKVR